MGNRVARGPSSRLSQYIRPDMYECHGPRVLARSRRTTHGAERGPWRCPSLRLAQEESISRSQVRPNAAEQQLVWPTNETDADYGSVSCRTFSSTPITSRPVKGLQRVEP